MTFKKIAITAATFLLATFGLALSPVPASAGTGGSVPISVNGASADLCAFPCERPKPISSK